MVLYLLLFDLFGHHRNLPQIAIQSIYIFQKSGSIDVFVISAMFFSVCSATISLITSISNRFKYNYMYSKSKKAKYHYRVKKSFKMKIECDNLDSYHKYTHKMIEKSMCYVLGIDNTGNIEVFYIVSARNAIIVYMEISEVEIEKMVSNAISNANNMNKKGLLSTILEFGVEGSSLSEALKQEINQRLKLNVATKIDPTLLEPGQNDIVVGNRIKIFIQQDHMLSFDATNIVNVASKDSKRDVTDVIDVPGVVDASGASDAANAQESITNIDNQTVDTNYQGGNVTKTTLNNVNSVSSTKEPTTPTSAYHE